ncbi:DMT family transporter [Kiloniella sp. EL199]|uniref:DMT family transporter n=1 Tax=Kiloniella sp. EL199 TaxID=2107581 RepID=UPI0013C41E99|nr:DMT family transporter [Kiloniella sp. EL199]
MELWIPITVAAALFQNIRTALQKHLKGRLDTTGATYARFLYAVPFSWIYLAILLLVQSADTATDITNASILPTINTSFLSYGAVGGIAQILATFVLVWLFGQRNFAVGTSLTKTEAIQTALFGFVLLGDNLSVQAIVGIIISLVGVLALYKRKEQQGSETQGSNESSAINRLIQTILTDRSILPGLIAGGLFALSAVSYRAASLSLEESGFAIQSAYTLVWVTGFQTLIMGAYILGTSPKVFIKVLHSWKAAIWIGLTGMLGSAGWFAAMTLENAAHVRTLGQVELIFTLLIGYFFFKERLKRKELMGIALITVGIITLILE